jgi:hypothetical protein
MAPEVAGVLSLAVTWTSQDRQHGREWLCHGGQRSPDHRARKLHRQRPATVTSMTSAPHPKGQPGAAHRPTQARSYHANVPANRRTPRPPNGVEQQPGRSPDPKAPSSTRAVREGVYPFKHCPIASFELEQDQPLSARARCPVVGHGRCASVPGPVRAQSRAARLNAEWV